MTGKSTLGKRSTPQLVIRNEPRTTGIATSTQVKPGDEYRCPKSSWSRFRWDWGVLLGFSNHHGVTIRQNALATRGYHRAVRSLGFLISIQSSPCSPTVTMTSRAFPSSMMKTLLTPANVSTPASGTVGTSSSTPKDLGFSEATWL